MVEAKPTITAVKVEETMLIQPARDEPREVSVTG
jgi:hypothetical protein